MPPRSQSSTSDKTKIQIIKSAEKLFADKGLRAMTLRDVTREAKVNLAAVNYHFGSKNDLMREVIGSRIEPINTERLRQLDALIEKHGSSPIPLTDIFDSLFRPLFQPDGPGSGPNPALIKIIGRAFAEPVDFMRGMHQHFFTELSRRYIAELKRTCPKLSDESLRNRFFLSVSTMLGATTNQVILENLSASKSSTPSYDTVVDELIQYAAAGFAHP
ncbi:MAG: TetR/AcrR family transcriptional regulator [Opitutaceae bacterium]